MENTKAKSVVIIIFVILLVEIVGFTGWYIYNNTQMNKKDNENTATINNLKGQIAAKEAQIKEKDEEISKLKE